MRITRKGSSNVNLAQVISKIKKSNLTSINNDIKNNSNSKKQKSFLLEKESLINGEPIKVQLVKNNINKKKYSTKTIDMRTFYNERTFSKQNTDFNENNSIMNLKRRLSNNIPKQNYKLKTELTINSNYNNNESVNQSNKNNLGNIDRLKKYLIPRNMNSQNRYSSALNRPKVISVSPKLSTQNIIEDKSDDELRQNNKKQSHKIRELLSQKFTYNKPKTTSTPSNIKKSPRAYDLKTYFNYDLRSKNSNNNINNDNMSVNSFNYNKSDKYKLSKDNASVASFEDTYSVITPNTNLRKEIKLDDLIIYDERLNDILVALNNNNTKGYEPDASNECAEFFVFYFHSTLQKTFPSFFSIKNKIVIESANNLTLLTIIITYHLSIMKEILKEVISMVLNILSLLKLNLYLIVKKIQMTYGDDFIEKNMFYFKTFNYYLRTKNLVNLKEDDIIFKIDQNCRAIVNDIKKILKIYQQINNPYHNDFFAIFNNISILSEKDLKDYFYARIYGFVNNKVDNKSLNLSNTKKRKINIIKGGNKNKINNKKNGINYETNEIKNTKIDDNNVDNSDVISVKSSKSSHYYGKIDKHNFKILKLINEYEKNKVEPPFIKTPNKKKYSIVFDLDETLINIEFKDIANNKCILHLRPGLFSFLSDIKPYCELMTFTSASKEYAQPIINEIESKTKYFDYNFFREHSIIYGNDFVKDISRIGRDMKKIIIIDNMEENYRLNIKNGIKIKAFYGDQNDNILFELKKILLMIFKQGYEDLTSALEHFSNEIKTKIS